METSAKPDFSGQSCNAVNEADPTGHNNVGRYVSHHNDLAFQSIEMGSVLDVEDTDSLVHTVPESSLAQLRYGKRLLSNIENSSFHSSSHGVLRTAVSKASHLRCKDRITTKSIPTIQTCKPKHGNVDQSVDQISVTSKSSSSGAATGGKCSVDSDVERKTDETLLDSRPNLVTPELNIIEISKSENIAASKRSGNSVTATRSQNVVESNLVTQESSRSKNTSLPQDVVTKMSGISVEGQNGGELQTEMDGYKSSQHESTETKEKVEIIQESGDEVNIESAKDSIKIKSKDVTKCLTEPAVFGHRGDKGHSTSDEMYGSDQIFMARKPETDHKEGSDKRESIEIQIPTTILAVMARQIHPIVRQTYKHYVKILGRRHRMTEQTKHRLSEISHLMQQM